MKKRLVLTFAFLFLFSISFASAQFNVERAIDETARVLEPLAAFFLGDIDPVGEAGYGEVLFVKFLVFILILVIVYLAVQRVPHLGDHRGVAFLIAVIISLISIRYMTSGEVVNFIWLPYGVLGVVLTSLLPLIIMFFFLQGFDSSALRKIGWTAFGVIFLFLTILRWDDLETDVFVGNLAWIYLIVAIISGLLIFFDRNIRSAILINRLGSMSDRSARINAAEIAGEIKDLKRRLADTDDPNTRKDIKRQIKTEERKMRDLLHS